MTATISRRRDLNISDHTLRCLLQEKKLFRIRHGWYSDEKPTQFMMLQVLQLMYPQLIFTGHTALQIHKGIFINDTIEAIVPYSVWLPRLIGVRVKRSRVPACETVLGLRCVSVAEAVADMPAYQRTFQDTNTVEDTYQGFKGIGKFLHDCAHARRRRKKKKLAVLDTMCIGTDSKSERRLGRALRAAGFTVKHNVKLGGYKFDISLVNTDVLIELDSYKYHGSPEHFTPQGLILDRWKSNLAVENGKKLLRFTTDDLYLHLHRIIQVVKTVVSGKPYMPQPVWMWHKFLQ